MNALSANTEFDSDNVRGVLYKDADAQIFKALDWIEKLMKKAFPAQCQAVREAAENQNHPYYSYIRRLFNDVDLNLIKTSAANFLINAI